MDSTKSVSMGSYSIASGFLIQIILNIFLIARIYYLISLPDIYNNSVINEAHSIPSILGYYFIIILFISTVIIIWGLSSKRTDKEFIIFRKIIIILGLISLPLGSLLVVLGLLIDEDDKINFKMLIKGMSEYYWDRRPGIMLFFIFIATVVIAALPFFLLRNYLQVEYLTSTGVVEFHTTARDGIGFLPGKLIYYFDENDDLLVIEVNMSIPLSISDYNDGINPPDLYIDGVLVCEGNNERFSNNLICTINDSTLFDNINYLDSISYWYNGEMYFLSFTEIEYNEYLIRKTLLLDIN